ncbi:hypothetical protein L6164_014769 [Bauhinia variegata]|uniref:Uncharacterized protein n=1 Tax=Bauhinia variegata TaxID=167791 RepID=A0ACB9NN96_BAUVA|nr:hypothetical protein L6164_014769 [Bauhinia variegata]
MSGVANLTLVNDARIDNSVIRMTNDSNQYSFGRAFYPTKIRMKPSSNSTNILSFSTSFVFSVLPEISTSPGFGLAFVLSNTTSPPGALASQYFGLFTNATIPTVYPLLAVEFDTGQNPEFNDPDDNHIGIDLNNIESKKTQSAGYYNSTGGFVPVRMRNGQNVRAWIEFNGTNLEIKVTVAPIGVSRPTRPTLTYRDPAIANYVSAEMYVGFSASKTNWVEAQRVLAWSLSDTGIARDINTTNLPVFEPESSSSSLSAGAIAGIVIACFVFVVICASGYFLWWRHKKLKEEEDEIEEWELEYWPHRFSYEELNLATGEFCKDHLLGSGGFGRVYKGNLPNNTEIAVKCLLNWEHRRRILTDVAEGLNYLHHGWDQVVIHRDIKSSNILLDSDMRGRLGDFGLAKLYQHGEIPNTTRVVGTLGYLAPELATVAAPTSASDVYSFGVVLLEVACGRKPIETSAPEEEVVLIDWVRELYAEGKAIEAADPRIKGEYNVGELEMVLKLGLACCHPDPLRRPTMKEVIALLVGEEVAAAPSELLSELARGDSDVVLGGDGDEDLGEAVPLQTVARVRSK